MKLALHTWGSEGDLRPFFVLADGLAQAGHEVRLAYASAEGRDYAATLSGARFAHEAVGAARPPEELARMAKEVFADRSPLRQFVRVLEQMHEPFLDALADSAQRLAGWADAVLLHPLAHPLAAAAQREGKPFLGVYTAPLFASRTLAPPGMPELGPLNGLAWRATLALLGRKLLPGYARTRAKLGLAPVRRVEDQLYRSALDLVAISPALFPRPPDWPDRVLVSGFLGAGASGAVPLAAELEAFLGAGTPPVYVTFGSMSAIESDPGAVRAAVEGAVQRAGCRAVVQLPGPSTRDVLFVGATAHAEVFPRCAAVVHHGGAGTTQAALLAGRPSVVVAHAVDQAMWGKQLRRLGVAPAHLTRRGLEPSRLARAVAEAASSAPMRARAEALAAAMRAEDGVRTAVGLVERAVAGARTGQPAR